MKVFGEDETQEESNSAMAANLPLTFILMFMVLLFLFKTYRKAYHHFVDGTFDFYRSGIWIAVTGKMLDFFAFGSFRIDRNEYQKCHCIGLIRSV